MFKFERSILWCLSAGGRPGSGDDSSSTSSHGSASRGATASSTSARGQQSRQQTARNRAAQRWCTTVCRDHFSINVNKLIFIFVRFIGIKPFSKLLYPQAFAGRCSRFLDQTILLGRGLSFKLHVFSSIVSTKWQISRIYRSVQHVFMMWPSANLKNMIRRHRHSTKRYNSFL